MKFVVNGGHVIGTIDQFSLETQLIRLVWVGDVHYTDFPTFIGNQNQLSNRNAEKTRLTDLGI